MTIERYIKRTVWISECAKCGMRDLRTDDPPREKRCACGDWHPFREQSYVGPEFDTHPIHRGDR